MGRLAELQTGATLSIAFLSCRHVIMAATAGGPAASTASASSAAAAALLLHLAAEQGPCRSGRTGTALKYWTERSLRDAAPCLESASDRTGVHSQEARLRPARMPAGRGRGAAAGRSWAGGPPARDCTGRDACARARTVCQRVVAGLAVLAEGAGAQAPVGLLRAALLLHEAWAGAQAAARGGSGGRLGAGFGTGGGGGGGALGRWSWCRGAAGRGAARSAGRGGALAQGSKGLRVIGRERLCVCGRAVVGGAGEYVQQILQG